MSTKYDKNDKYRMWMFVLYPESMVNDWQERLYDLQVPICYIIHDKDNYLLDPDEKERKIHVHLWVVWNNTVWYGAILKILNKLLAKKVIDNKTGDLVFGSCGSTAEPVFNPKFAFLYLCHKDPKSLKLEYKFKYDDSERICLNNFDIGSYIELDKHETMRIKSVLTHAIFDNKIMDTLTLFFYVESNYDDYYMYVFQNFHAYFNNQCTACWKKFKRIADSDTTT